MKWNTGLVAAAALALAMLTSACMGAGVGQITSPSAVADKTTLDERLMLGADLGYKAARKAVLLADDAKPLSAKAASRLKEIDQKVFAALEKATKAYNLANAAGYDAALAEIGPLIIELWSLSAKNGDQK